MSTLIAAWEQPWWTPGSERGILSSTPQEPRSWKVCQASNRFKYHILTLGVDLNRLAVPSNCSSKLTSLYYIGYCYKSWSDFFFSTAIKWFDCSGEKKPWWKLKVIEFWRCCKWRYQKFKERGKSKPMSETNFVWRNCFRSKYSSAFLKLPLP